MTFEEYEASRARRKGLSADTAQLKQQFGQAGQDQPGPSLADLDFTNPANMMNFLHHGVPMALQMGATAAVGPEANPLLKMLASALGSAGGYLFQSAAEPAAKGEPITANVEDTLGNALLGGAVEGGVQLGGGVMRRVTGKTGLVREGAAAEQAAEQKALQGQQAFDEARVGAEQEQVARIADVGTTAKTQAEEAIAKAQAKVETTQEAIKRLELKHSEAALSGVREDTVVNELESYLKSVGTPKHQNPTIETLTEQATPVRQSAQRSIRSVFSGVSRKFDELLAPYENLPVPEASFASAVEQERALLEQSKDTVSKKLAGLMDDLSSMDANAPLNVSALPAVLQQERTMLLRSHRMTPAQVDAHIRKLASGMPKEMGAEEAFMPTTVARLDNVRKKLTGIVIGDSSPVEKRVANRLIQSIDGSLEPVLPPEVQASWTTLRNEWHEANNVFSPTFRSMLFRADAPAKVADVLFGSGKGNVNRVLTVIGKTPAEELPLLRSAYADRLTRGDILKNVESQDPRVFKAFFNGTGFDTPKGWTEALRNNLDYNAIMSNPNLRAQWNDRYQQGMKSWGMQRYQAALAKAEEVLKSQKDPGGAMIEAMKNELTPQQAGDVAMRGKVRPDVGAAKQEARLKGEMEGMTEPIIGRRFMNYIEHYLGFHAALAMASLGAIGGHYLNHPLAASLPLAYIGSSRAAAAMLANPTIGKLWYNALTSKTAEQAAFLFGRLAAAGLTEGARSSD